MTLPPSFLRSRHVGRNKPSSKATTVVGGRTNRRPSPRSNNNRRNDKEEVTRKRRETQLLFEEITLLFYRNKTRTLSTRTMGDDQQQQQTTQPSQQQQPHQPQHVHDGVPFSPVPQEATTTAAAAAAAAGPSSNFGIGSNVLRELMNVYENLTQSSTPQGNAEPTSNTQQQQQPQQPPPPSPLGHHHYPPPTQTQQESHHTPPPQPQLKQDPSTSYASNTNDATKNAAHFPPEPYPSSFVPPREVYAYPTSAAAAAAAATTTITPQEQPSIATRPKQSLKQEPSEQQEHQQPPTTTSSTSGRTLRKRSLDSTASTGTSSSTGKTSKSRKKTKQDGRWSKRFTWPEELHRDFVSAIFDVGLKHSSPSTILEHMPPHEQITTERIKSHLQKYRLHRTKSKQEFMTSYDTSMQKLNASGTAGLVPPINNGQIAAHLSYTTVHGTNATPDTTATKTTTAATPTTPPASAAQPKSSTSAVSHPPPTMSPTNSSPAATTSANKDTNKQSSMTNTNEVLMLPQLTEAEKNSQIGASMGYLMGLFFSLKQMLLAQRAAAKEDAFTQTTNNEDARAVYNSFVATPPVTLPSTAATAAAAVTQPLPTLAQQPSLRNNLEESNMMKREMQSQMAFQNKMRALKQQELNKYKNIKDDHDATTSSQQEREQQQQAQHQQLQLQQRPITTSTDPQQQQQQQQQQQLHHPPTTKEGWQQQHQQVAGEEDDNDNTNTTDLAGNNNQTGGRNRGMSVGNSDDFWNTDTVDEQLFEFLMNN